MLAKKINSSTPVRLIEKRNPKLHGSKSHATYAAMLSVFQRTKWQCLPFGVLKSAGYSARDARWDEERGFIELIDTHEQSTNILPNR